MPPDIGAVTAVAPALTGEVVAERRERRRYLLLLVPALAVLAVLFLYPLLGVVARSVFKDTYTLEFYGRALSEPVYLTVVGLTFRTAALTTLVCLLLGYPLAYVLVNLPPRVSRLLLIVVILPFFTSIIVRTYAWMVLLGRTGVVNDALLVLGLVERPLRLLYNPVGMLLGMSYVLLPYMVLTAYSVMRGIDPSLIRAAHSLGATRLQAFWRIFLPLSLPGVAGGTLLVFILSLGFFITPRLMGSPSDVMIAMLIEHEVEFTLNWSFASALAVMLLAITLVGFAFYNRLARLDRMFQGGA